MVATQSLWGYFAEAGFVVKCVMFILSAASVLSWTCIFQRGYWFWQINQNARQFGERFWSGLDMSRLFAEVGRNRQADFGMASIFHAGFKEYTRQVNNGVIETKALMPAVSRAMRIAKAHETERLEKHLPFLASVGSTSPYIGLFGTVWGIMTAFQALGNVKQASIAMVAPGISEALVATALGLFAAIPAVLAYNRYAAMADNLTNQYETFQEEFIAILQRQNHGEA